MKRLVVEDDTDIRNGIVQFLEESSYLVDAVDNGVEAVYRALNWEYDAILLDVMLPGKSGWEVLKEVREVKNTPVLMLTALGDLDDRLRGLDNGADDYLAKPYAPQELLARVRALLRRSSGVGTNTITLGRVTIDLSLSTVTLDDEPVKLTKAQFHILVYLAKRAGQVVSSSELMDAVSGDDNSTLSNVVDVQVFHIRRQLGKDFVLNQRGHGYYIAKD